PGDGVGRRPGDRRAGEWADGGAGGAVLPRLPVYAGAGAERGRDVGPVVAGLAGVRARPGRGDRGVLGAAGLQAALGRRGRLGTDTVAAPAGGRAGGSDRAGAGGRG